MAENDYEGRRRTASLWDVGTPGGFIRDTMYNAPLAVRVGKGGAAELISAGVEQNGAEFAGRLAVRTADPLGKPERLWLTAPAGSIHVPLAIAPLSLKEPGDATAVLIQVDPRPAGEVGRPLRLQFVDSRGNTLGKVHPLAGDPGQVPSLAASPDSRFVAVAGFSDNRVEVYDAAAFATGNG